MGNRLSKITTRTGDDGTTGLGDGSRIAKTSSRIQALGEVDELNSWLGILRAEELPEEAQQILAQIQNDLFDLGGELCIPGYTLLKDEHIARLESALAQFNAPLTPLKEFILPGGSRAAALAHLARTVARRAERAVLILAASETINLTPQHYLNRLSDLLFVLGRWLNAQSGGQDVLWQRRVDAGT